MAKSNTNGICYICGAENSKIVTKNHILKHHNGGDEECFLLTIEGAELPDYWLIIDVPLEKSLSALDTFLRKIWLECCGHLSEFNDKYNEKVGKARKIREFDIGDKLYYYYDFGSTTELLVTFVAKTSRPKQKSPVRLLARNIAPKIKCKNCGNVAEQICAECGGAYEDAFYCNDCRKKHKHKTMLPVTNSPRSGECGYTGEFDVFEYKANK